MLSLSIFRRKRANGIEYDDDITGLKFIVYRFWPAVGDSFLPAGATPGEVLLDPLDDGELRLNCPFEEKFAEAAGERFIRGIVLCSGAETLSFGSKPYRSSNSVALDGPVISEPAVRIERRRCRYDASPAGSAERSTA